AGQLQAAHGRLDLFGAPGVHDTGAQLSTEPVAAGRQTTLRQLGLTGGLREDELDDALARHAQEARLHVHRRIRRRPGALHVVEERLADVGERDLFRVLEGTDRRVFATTGPAPRADQRGDGCETGVRSHAARLPKRTGSAPALAPGTPPHPSGTASLIAQIWKVAQIGRASCRERGESAVGAVRRY